jgi:hypothetical protein
VPGRSILLFVAVLLVIAALASALAPRERRLLTPTHTTSTQAAPATLPPQTVNASLPPAKTVKARPGDIVNLKVTYDQPDEVQIFDLGLHAPVGPSIPADLTFVATQTGSFPVTMRDSGAKVGTIQVQPAS